MERRWSYVLTIVIASFIVLGGAATCTCVSAPIRIDGASIAKVGEMVGRPAYIIGRTLDAAPAKSSSLKVLMPELKSEVEVALAKPLATSLDSYEMVMVLGEVYSLDGRNGFRLEKAVIQRVCRLRGRLADGEVSYSGAVFFLAPFEAVTKALDAGKGGLMDIISSGKIVGMSDSNGDYDFVIPIGKWDILGLYTDKSNANRSMLWVFSLEFGSDELIFNMGSSKAALKW